MSSILDGITNGYEQQIIFEGFEHQAHGTHSPLKGMRCKLIYEFVDDIFSAISPTFLSSH